MEDYADAFVNEGGVEDKKQAYNYALDAYLEGLGEFWASVEVVDEEEYDAEAEEAALQAEADEEEEEFNELRLAAGIPLPKSAAKPLKPRFSLPGNMGTSLLNLFWQKKEKVKNPPQPVRQSSIDDSMGDSLFSLFDDGSETVEDNFIDEVKEIVADIKVSETTINNSLALGMAVDAVLEQAAEGEGEEEEEEDENMTDLLGERQRGTKQRAAVNTSQYRQNMYSYSSFALAAPDKIASKKEATKAHKAPAGKLDAFAMMMGANSLTAPTKKRAARKATKAPKAPDDKKLTNFFPMKMGAKSPTAPTVDMTLDTR